jgi:hypothetical protein
LRAVDAGGGAVVIDHFIQGDGTPNGSQTLPTALPSALREINPKSLTLEYRDEIVAIASEFFPGRVGVNIDVLPGACSLLESEK